MSRVLIKLSGEALAGDKHFGFDDDVASKVAKELSRLSNEGHEIAIVIGGGNFWRGRSSASMDRVLADEIGMMATVMNCLYMSDMLRRFGAKTVVMTPFSCGGFTRLFSRDDADILLKERYIVFFAGGTGHPYFSTDTGAVLRAIEIGADALLLAKAIDGIYSADPKKDKSAVKYKEISIEEVVDKKLQATDLSASIMCLENHMPLVVFSLSEEDSIIRSMPIDGKPGSEFNGTFVSA